MSPTQRHSHVVIGVRLLPCRQACRRAASRAREVFEPSFRGQSAAQGYLYLFIPPTTTPHFGNYVDAKFLSFRGAKSAAQRLIIMHYTPHFGNYASATRRYVNLDVNQLESAENRCSLRARTHAGSISPRGFQVADFAFRMYQNAPFSWALVISGRSRISPESNLGACGTYEASAKFVRRDLYQFR